MTQPTIGLAVSVNELEAQKKYDPNDTICRNATLLGVLVRAAGLWDTPMPDPSEHADFVVDSIMRRPR